MSAANEPIGFVGLGAMGHPGGDARAIRFAVILLTGCFFRRFAVFDQM